jgi:hypothetical protein
MITFFDGKKAVDNIFSGKFFWQKSEEQEEIATQSLLSNMMWVVLFFVILLVCSCACVPTFYQSLKSGAVKCVTRLFEELKSFLRREQVNLNANQGVPVVEQGVPVVEQASSTGKSYRAKHISQL